MSHIINQLKLKGIFIRTNSIKKGNFELFISIIRKSSYTVGDTF